MDWQRNNIQAAAVYLRERIAGGASDIRTRTVYEGLLEVLDPKRRTLRLQREQAEAAKASAPVPIARDRRTSRDRRDGADRRRATLGPPAGSERRSGHDRRTGLDRRNLR